MTDKRGRPVIFGEVLFDSFADGSLVPGGAPFNVAWHLQAWGRVPLFISRVGDDRLGRDIHRAMTDWGLDTAGLQTDDSRPTGTVEVTISGGEPVFEIIADRAYDHIRAEVLPDVAAALLYHGTLAVRNHTSALALRQLKQQSSAPVFLDVNLRPPWWQRDMVVELLREADRAKLNLSELEMLADGGVDVEDMARRLLDRYRLEQLIVTLGKDGAMAVDSGRNTVAVRPVAAGRFVDSVGAGDAFTSVLILGYMLDWPPALTLERAQQFATAIVGIQGATIGEREFYYPFIEQWDLTKP